MKDEAKKACELEATLERLTEAQRAFLLFLPSDGRWAYTNESDFNRYGPNALRGFGQSGLIEGIYRDPMKHRLTAFGVTIAARLRDDDAREGNGR